MIIIIMPIIGRSMMPTFVDCTFRWKAPTGSDVLGLPVYHALLKIQTTNKNWAMAAPSRYTTRHCRSLHFGASMLSPVISTARWGNRPVRCHPPEHLPECLESHKHFGH